ncbi:tRNA (adenine(58)-N(1))-methyltransferase TrmI [Paramyrothecium foliicola]|nr:tRNA (adenine(58)-N(1))-methyltransferase TrmI [Paramyrothecium foliicola]
MASIGRTALGRASKCLSRRHFSSDRTVKELDVLYLRQNGQKYPHWHLTKPLQAGARVKLSFGASIPASDLIGRKILDTIVDSKGNRVILHEATTGSYIVNSERYATPIYPHDANTIVALLDLNLPRPGEEDEAPDAPPFEVFEAGTGMGSLTMHVARALHAANPPVSPQLRRNLATAALRSGSDSPVATNADDANSTGEAVDSEGAGLASDIEGSSRDGNAGENQEADATAVRVHMHPDARPEWAAYRASRRAILHTLDNRQKHTGVAFKLVRDFNRALYLPNIDFHTGTINDFITTRLARTGGQPFLSRAILDLPQSEDHAGSVVRAMRNNALLVLFKPSISQIASFQAWAVETNQPVRLEKVVELPISTRTDGGLHNSSGGREWDVKMVTPKADEGHGRLVQVMRPKVGDRIAGGGFVAVFRRWPEAESSAGSESLIVAGESEAALNGPEEGEATAAEDVDLAQTTDGDTNNSK